MKLLAVLLMLIPFAAIGQSKTDYKKPGAAIPAFTIEKADGKVFTNTVLSKGKPAIIMIFSPECDHCVKMLDTMKSFAADMKKTEMVLVTEARNKASLKEFVEKHELGAIPAFQQIGWDKGNLIYYIYTFQLLPQVNVYNDKHQLMRTFSGTFSLDSLKQYME